MTPISPSPVLPDDAPTPPSVSGESARVEPVELPPSAPGSPLRLPLPLTDSMTNPRATDVAYEIAWTKAKALIEPPKGSSAAFKRLWEDSFTELQAVKPRVIVRKRITSRDPITGKYDHESYDVLEPANVTMGELLQRIGDKLGQVFDETVGRFDQTLAQLAEKIAKAEKLSDRAGWAEILSLAKANLICDLMFGEAGDKQKATHKALDTVTKLASEELKKQIKDGVGGAGDDTSLDLLVKLRDSRDRLERERRIFAKGAESGVEPARV